MNTTAYTTPTTARFVVELVGENKNRVPVCTVRQSDPIVTWLKVASEWNTYPAEYQKTCRPVVAKAVRFLFCELAADYEPSKLGVWYEEDIFRRGMADVTESIGGVFQPPVWWPYVAALAGVGFSDAEITEILGPGFDTHWNMSSGEGYDPDDVQ